MYRGAFTICRAWDAEKRRVRWERIGMRIRWETGYPGTRLHLPRAKGEPQNRRERNYSTSMSSFTIKSGPGLSRNESFPRDRLLEKRLFHCRCLRPADRGAGRRSNLKKIGNQRDCFGTLSLSMSGVAMRPSTPEGFSALVIPPSEIPSIVITACFFYVTFLETGPQKYGKIKENISGLSDRGLSHVRPDTEACQISDLCDSHN